jgi:hypothetical protein
MNNSRERIGHAFRETPSLFELLRTVRSRRVGHGYRVDSGTTESHPVTGRTMVQQSGPRSFVSSREPLPLTEVEEALIAWAMCGPNGLVAWEASMGAGFNQLIELRGRTAPEANNLHATDLLVINDNGTFLYKPEITERRPLQMQGDEVEMILDWYRHGLVRVLDGRPDIDWAMRRAAAPSVPLHGSHQYNLNRPGSTWMIPLTDAAALMSGMIDLFGGRHMYITDEFNGNRPAGLDEFVRSGMLESSMPISVHEQGILVTSAYPAGCMVQNGRLAAEAMGIGAWCLSGYDDHLLFGSEPELMRGLGFHCEPPNARAPVATGSAKTYGIAGIKTSTYVPSPAFATARELVEFWRDQQFGEGGWAQSGSRAQTVWPKTVAAELAGHPAARPEEWAFEAAERYIQYAVDTFGSWPVTYDPMLAGFSVVFHHVDTEYYDAYHPALITDRIRSHDDHWHGQARRHD